MEKTKMMSTKNGATLYFNLEDSTYEVVNGSREDILSALREDMEGEDKVAKLMATSLYNSIMAMEFLESLN